MQEEMAKLKDLSLARAMWTDEFWYPDSSILVEPPIDTQSYNPMPTLLVGKQALLSCLKYKGSYTDHIFSDIRAFVIFNSEEKICICYSSHLA